MAISKVTRGEIINDRVDSQSRFKSETTKCGNVLINDKNDTLLKFIDIKCPKNCKTKYGHFGGSKLHLRLPRLSKK